MRIAQYSDGAWFHHHRKAVVHGVFHPSFRKSAQNVTVGNLFRTISLWRVPKVAIKPYDQNVTDATDLDEGFLDSVDFFDQTIQTAFNLYG